jgi:Tfp pilus assembly protein PilX
MPSRDQSPGDPPRIRLARAGQTWIQDVAGPMGAIGRKESGHEGLDVRPVEIDVHVRTGERGSRGKEGFMRSPEHRHLARLRGRSDDERGASLILALVFLIVVSLITISLATWVSADLRNSLRFTRAQNTVTTANAATEVAMQYVRYNFDPTAPNIPSVNAWPPVLCVPGSGTFTLNNTIVTTWCTTRWFEGQYPVTRRVTISTCPNSESNTYCVEHPYLQAIISYNDFPVTNVGSICVPGTTSTTTGSTCGTGIRVDSWAYGVTPPTVTTATLTGTQTCSTKPLTITGVGFESPATIDLVYQNNPGGTAYQATNVVVTSSTTIQACLPLNAAGTTWTGTAYVMVNTPTGTSSDTNGTAASEIVTN